LKKKNNTNPARGPYHFRSPSRMVWRTIRAMMQHKTARCQAALERLKVLLFVHISMFAYGILVQSKPGAMKPILPEDERDQS